MKLPRLLIMACLGALPASAISPPASGIDAVSQAAIQNAFQILRTEYIRSGDLTFDELNRATLQGLLQRLDLGAELLSKDQAARLAVRPGLLTEHLTPQIAYLRPLAFAQAEVAKLEAKLTELRDARVPHLILDLRSAAPSGEFEAAAAMLDLFIPRGELLFRLKQVGRDDAELFLSNRDAVWTQKVIVLIDGETNNLGETMAAALRRRNRAILVGSATRGATVRYTSLPIDDTHVLRFAHAEMLLPDGESLFKKGLQPDFVVHLAPADKRKVFDVVDDSEQVPVNIFDRARLRYNEAALVARKNPELDAYIKRSAGLRMEDDSPAVRDTVLQRAVDMLTAKLHLGATAIDWKQAPAGSKSSVPTIRKAAPVDPP